MKTIQSYNNEQLTVEVNNFVTILALAVLNMVPYFFIVPFFADFFAGDFLTVLAFFGRFFAAVSGFLAADGCCVFP
jgi:hypothetical protein